MANGCRQWDRDWGRSREEKAASEESMVTEDVTKEDPESDSKEASNYVDYCASVWFDKENVMCLFLN